MKRVYQEPHVKEAEYHFETLEVVPIEEVDEYGVVHSSFTEKKIDTLKVFEGMKYTDFSLSKLLRTNATDLLQPHGSIKQSPLQVADTITNFE